ncbi:class I SAM-dependent methyltransferase [Mucilaginibacter sp.]|jgi:2-polyprenyl-3-methyl-5-hydroxy-6-metoxy-1,4-benzoquinol methylase|uniref:class I SAM-dependent methyltransferase n=1 Tax=Mucilaginibacter sp. TaxID=1882438 RepID=UPI002CB50DCA|nr:class I SAM-dependent methyltransferase [Mucilaginibacter sp.]HTI60944.1 class I SAM-dependent methyltransferase [Mucilaginibacter sp.]
MADYKDYGFTTGSPAHTFGYLQEPLMALLDKQKNQSILDLGCGNGYLATYLLKQGYNAYGTDASAEGIAIAKREYPDRFFLQDLSTGKLPDELLSARFDTIISTEVIEHLYDPAGFIDFCKKCLPNGGELIISTPYHGYLKNLSLALFNHWDKHLSPEWHGGHIKFWSRKTLSKLLTDKGFRVTDFKGCGRMPYFWKSMIIKAELN